MELFNRVKFATSTTGTSDIAVGARETGFLTPALAGVSNGDTVPYFIEDGDNFAHGLGTYSTSGPSLTRDSGEVSWNGSSYAAGKLSLSGSAKVYIAPRAVDLGKTALSPGPELTIASGAITVTHNKHQVDTESDASTDDLFTINGGTDGMILALSSANGGRDVVLKASGGNLKLVGSTDFTLSDVHDLIVLMWQASSGIDKWVEIVRADLA